MSVKTAAPQTVHVLWWASCNNALWHGPGVEPRPKIYRGTYTSHGMGSKVPVKIGVKKAFDCLVSVHAAPNVPVNSLYISFWRD